MNSFEAAEKLEVCLIELEYATADFTGAKASAAISMGLVPLEPLLSKLGMASRAVQIAIFALRTQSSTDLRAA